MNNAVKFEVEIKKSALLKLRQFMNDNDFDPGADEDMIQELFLMTSLRKEIDVRDSVDVSKIS